MNEKVLLIDGVKYNLWIPEREVEEFEPIVIQHIKDIFGKGCRYFPRRKLKTLANNRSIPDGFVIDFKDKKWYILELKLLCDDAIRRITGQIVTYNKAIENLKMKKEIYDDLIIKKEIHDAIGESLYHLIYNTDPEIVIIINSLDGEIGKQFREQVEGTDRDVKIIEFKTYARDYVDPKKVHVHLFEPLYKGFKREEKRERGKRKEKEKTKRARKGEITPQKVYYIPILESLIELGGSGRVKDVEERVERKMKNIFKEKDYETLSSDGITIRWRNKTHWARFDLVSKYGYLKNDSPRGVWEISDKGRRYYEENKDKYGS